MLDQVRQRITCAGMGHTLALYLACPHDKFCPQGYGPRLALFILKLDGQIFDVAFDCVERPVPLQTLLGDRAGSGCAGIEAVRMSALHEQANVGRTWRIT